MAKKYVLIVDDDPDMVETVGMMLESKGYEVGKAYDGIEGEESIKARQPDLVVLDVMMPGMDGFEVCRAIRADSRIPVVMLTARGEDTDRIVGLELGADDYLPKPFNPRELVARILAVLRRGAPDDAAVLQAAGVRLDPARREVTADGAPREVVAEDFVYSIKRQFDPKNRRRAPGSGRGGSWASTSGRGRVRTTPSPFPACARSTATPWKYA